MSETPQYTTVSPDEACPLLKIGDFPDIEAMKGALGRLQKAKPETLIKSLSTAVHSMAQHEMHDDPCTKFARKNRTMMTIKHLLFPLGLEKILCLPYPGQDELKAFIDGTKEWTDPTRILHDIVLELTAAAATAINAIPELTASIATDGPLCIRSIYESLEQLYNLTPSKVSNMTKQILFDGTFSGMYTDEVIDLQDAVTHTSATNFSVRMMTCMNWNLQAAQRPGPLQNFPQWQTRIVFITAVSELPLPPDITNDATLTTELRRLTNATAFQIKLREYTQRRENEDDLRLNTGGGRSRAHTTLSVGGHGSSAKDTRITPYGSSVNANGELRLRDGKKCVCPNGCTPPNDNHFNSCHTCPNSQVFKERAQQPHKRKSVRPSNGYKTKRSANTKRSDNRPNIPCRNDTKPGGCSRDDCMFKHAKARGKQNMTMSAMIDAKVEEKLEAALSCKCGFGAAHPKATCPFWQSMVEQQTLRSQNI